jgi:hypothetical protein
METLKYAQDLIKSNNYVSAGFNQFINGNKEPKRTDYGSPEQWYSESQGYDYAKKMAKEEGIAFTHIFKCEKSGCFPFNYGGFMVCNSCGNKDVDKEWWRIKVEKDGNQYCCHGLDFVNLQESENYAFGHDFETAIENYRSLMLKS